MHKNDKNFIEKYCGDRDLKECMTYYKKRFDSRKDYYALFVVAELSRIKGYFNQAQCHYETLCKKINCDTISTFKHINGDKIKQPLKATLFESYKKLCLLYEFSYTINYRKAVKLLSKGCKLNIAECYIALGSFYIYSNHNKQALKYLQKAVDLGAKNVDFYLGMVYHSLSDYTKAMEYYQKSIDDGYYDAYLRLALMYEWGNGVEKDKGKAFEYYQKALESKYFFGYAKGKIYYELGCYYKNGKVVEADSKKAIKYLQKAIKYDYNEAYLVLADVYKSQQNYTKALKLYKKALKCNRIYKGHIYYQIGVLYRDGLGVKQDYTKTIKLWTKAADLKLTSARYDLAEMYENGVGIAQDKQKALYYYKKSYKTSSGVIYKRGYESYKRLKKELSKKK